MSDSGRQAFQREHEHWICLDCETKWQGVNPPQLCPSPSCQSRNTAQVEPDVDLDGRTVHHAPLRAEAAPTPSVLAALREGDDALLQLADCAPYLKEGETPVACIQRHRKDIDALLELLKQERAESSRLPAAPAPQEQESEANMPQGYAAGWNAAIKAFGLSPADAAPAPAPWTKAQVEGEANYIGQFHSEQAKRTEAMLRYLAQTLPATVPAPVAPLEYDCTTCGAHWVAVLPSRACPECCGLFIKKRDRSAPATVPAPAPAREQSRR